jgi:hypothetical protein
MNMAGIAELAKRTKEGAVEQKEDPPAPLA